MKKEYTIPEIEIVTCLDTDIISTSFGNDNLAGYINDGGFFRPAEE